MSSQTITINVLNHVGEIVTVPEEDFDGEGDDLKLFIGQGNNTVVFDTNVEFAGTNTIFRDKIHMIQTLNVDVAGGGDVHFRPENAAARNIKMVQQADGSGDVATWENIRQLRRGLDANSTNIDTNYTAIITNSTAIVINSVNIATNSTAIATNSSDIATNSRNITTNSTNIATNSTAIVTNSSDIKTNSTAIAAIMLGASGQSIGLTRREIAFGSDKHKMQSRGGFEFEFNSAQVILTVGGIGDKISEGVIKTGAIHCFSDRRLKENIEDLDVDYFMNEVSKIVPQKYNFIGTPTVRYGFIAQDIPESLSELVLEGSNGLLSVNYLELIALIPSLCKRVKALQEIV